MTRSEAIVVYELNHQRFDKTREIQWKFNVAMWTLLAASIYFFRSHHIIKCNCIFWILWILFFLSHSLFIYLTQRSLQFSKDACNYILESLNNSEERLVINWNKESIDKNIKLGPKAKLWITFQLLATLILLIILAIVYYQ